METEPLFAGLLERLLQRQRDNPPESSPKNSSTSLRPGRFDPATGVLRTMKPDPRLRPGKPRREELIPKQIRQTIRQVCRGELPWPLTIHGEAGRGKSSAALLLLDCVQHGVYVTGRECVTSEFSSDHQAAGKFRYDWKRADLVVIDQFGMDWRDAMPCPPSVVQVFVDLIDYRSDQGKPLVIVSNHDLPTLGRLSDNQIFSRLAGGTIVRFEGPDMRIQKPGAK